MRFNIISNLNNGVGLQRNYEVLQKELLSRGHQVHGIQFNATPLLAYPADVNIFDEVVVPLVFKAAPVQWAMPHPEWWFKQWDQYPWDRVLAKTRDCERIFQEKMGNRCQYLGWAARDLYQAGIPKERKFVHVSGKSHFKNTQAVILGCQRANVPLTVIGVSRWISETELKCVMNSHFCHIMPSAYEGYGHVLHESQSVGQILITTDAPPMNELSPAFYIPSVSMKAHHAAPLHTVSEMGVSTAVQRVMELSQAELDQLSADARASYHQNVQQFRHALDELVGSV